METPRVSSKGQVVLPKAVREDLDWPAGTDLTVERCEDSVVLRRKSTVRPTTIDHVIGMFKVDRPISDREIERAIDEGYRARWRRKR
jgi:AbrB family looped-hinge helix DNA binding protein